MPINLGTSAIDDVRLGTGQVDKVMLGTELVWQSAVPLPNIGDPLMGGFYVGIIDTTVGNIIAADYFQTGDRFALIVSDIALENTSLTYKPTNTAAPADASTRWNGQGATAAMNSADYPAAQYCAGLSYPDDSGSPWYLPSLDEMELIYRNFKPTTENNYTGSATGDFPPTAQDSGYNPSSDPVAAKYTTSNPSQTSLADFKTGGAQALEQNIYWTATEYNASYAWDQLFTGSNAGRQNLNNKFGGWAVRPCRRLPL